jgi:catechol 2,3-dioxygenase-like lactoylglutathione lyase family enzyme
VTRPVGINHVALEVGSIDEALAFLERILGPLELRGRMAGNAFVDLGDQFLALFESPNPGASDQGHFGFVVDDKEAVRARLDELGIEILPGPFLDFRDPWGNRIEIVDYRDVQFSKTPAVLRGMGLDGLQKTDKALAELRAKGLAEDAA